MKLMKKMAAVLLVLSMLFVFTSCLGETEEVLDIGTVNLGIITDGDIEDEATTSFVHYEAFKSAYSIAGASDKQVTEQYNITAGDSAAMAKAMADLIARGCRLIIGTNEAYYEEFVKYSKENVSVFFVLLADYKNSNPELKNLSVFTIRNYEAEYIQGALAALYSSSGKLGYVVDSKYSTADKVDINSFALGAQSINPKASVALFVADDIKAACESLTASGCDTLYTRNYEIDEDGNTCFETPTSSKNNMCLITLENNSPVFISSAYQNLNVVYTKIITETVNEKFEAIKGFSSGVKEGGVDVRPVENEENQKTVDQLKERLFKGENILGDQNILDLADNYISAVTQVK